ncbi:MAG: ATP-binding cassette domain-containing protein [bacterium]
MIRFEHVRKWLGDHWVLEDVSFEIQRGEIFFIVGPSGTGKSVTLRHMVRLLTPDDGRVMIGEDCVSTARGRELERIRTRFGVLFQSGALLEWLTVAENVALPLRELTELEPAAIEAQVREKLELVGLPDAMDKYPSEISGGMRKRAALARAIILKPEIMLYDEPTSGLDPVSARMIDALIADMQAKTGITSIVVTHDLHSALSIGTRIAMLFDGRVIELAEPAAFVQSQVSEVCEFLDSQYITRRGDWERKAL